MQEESLIAGCVCLTFVLLLNAGCGPLAEERRMVDVPALLHGEEVSVSGNAHTFQEGIKKARPLQLAVFVGPVGILSNYYTDRVPALIFIIPGVLGVSLEQAAWSIPAIQVTMSCYSLFVVNKYAKTFIPSLSIRDFLARDFNLGDPRSMDEDALHDLYWEQVLNDSVQDRSDTDDRDAFHRMPQLG